MAWQAASAFTLEHENIYLKMSGAAKIAPTSQMFPNASGTSVAIASTTTHTNQVEKRPPLLATGLNTNNPLRIRVLKTKVVTTVPQTSSGPTRGQILVDMSIPYAKKVNYDRSDNTNASPLGRDVALIITPVCTDLPLPAVTGHAQTGVLNANNPLNRAGFCHITSEFYFKDS